MLPSLPIQKDPNPGRSGESLGSPTGPPRKIEKNPLLPEKGGRTTEAPLITEVRASESGLGPKWHVQTFVGLQIYPRMGRTLCDPAGAAISRGCKRRSGQT